MLTNQIIDIALNQFLDDVEKPITYQDSYLAQCASEAEREATERGYLLISYPETSPVTTGDLSSGVATSTMTDKLVDSGATFTSTYLNKTVYNTTDNTFATITAVDTATQLSLSSDIMVSGEAYTVGDASKALTRLCVASGQSQYSFSSKVLKIKDCYLNSNKILLHQKTVGWLDEHYRHWRLAAGTPKYYIEDMGSLRLVPTPDATFNESTGKDTLFISVYRLPLSDLTLAADSMPEIPDEYHFPLIHWICYLVFSKQNNPGNMNKAQWHETKFTEKFGRKLSNNAKEALREMPSDFTISQPSIY